MALSRLAQQFADEIREHDWSDAHNRLDRAGHRRADDRPSSAAPLAEEESDYIRTNVMWVTAQVLRYNDRNFDVHEFAERAGVPASIRLRKDGSPSGAIDMGLRINRDGEAHVPGTRDFS